jgi:hypothetical protein
MTVHARTFVIAALVLLASCSAREERGRASLSMLAIHPDDGGVEVRYSTQPPGVLRPGGWWTEPAAVDLRLVDGAGEVIARRLVQETGPDVRVRFGGLENGERVTVWGRALDAHGHRGWTAEAWTVPGVAPEVTVLARGAANPSFSPDGTALVVDKRVRDADHGAFSNVATIDVGTGVETLLTDFSPVEDVRIASPLWSPDGRTIAYCHCALESCRESGRCLGIIRLGEGTGPVTVACGLNCFAGLFWIPGGDGVDLVEKECLDTGDGLSCAWAWSRVDLATGSMTTVREHGGSVRLGRPDVSPDGELLCYLVADLDFSRSDLVVERVVTHEEVARHRVGWADWQHEHAPLSAAWSPDGRRIAVAALFGGRDRWDVWVLELQDATWTPLTGYVGQIELEAVTGLDWSPDGRFIAVSSKDLYMIGL